MKYRLFYLALLIPYINLFSQFDYSFSGYVVELPIFAFDKERPVMFPTEDNQMFFNLTRIRLCPEFYLWEGARLNYEHEFDILYSKSNNEILFNDKNVSRQIVNLRWQAVNENNFLLTHYIDRLYLRQGFNWGNITIGRQRIAFGSGRVWNPTDLFNPINPANYSKIEKDGVDAILLNYFFGSFTNAELVYNPIKGGKTNAGFRFRTNFNEFDLSAIGGYFDSKIVGGLDFAGNLFDAGVRGEGIISINKDDASTKFLKFILGADYQFTPKLYVMIEYHFNGEGKVDKFNYEFMRLINGEILNLSRNYLMINTSYMFSPIVTASASHNRNLNDGSGFAGINASYSAGDNFYINVGVLSTYGDIFTEYWYYPHSVYFQAEYYF